MRTLRPVLFAATLAAAGCTSAGFGSGKPSLTAANNPPASAETPPENEFFSLLDSDAGMAAYAAQKEALQAPSGGIAVPWQAGGISGTVTPGPIHMVNQRTCRDVTHVTLRDKERLRGQSTLCRTREGDWKPLDAL